MGVTSLSGRARALVLPGIYLWGDQIPHHVGVYVIRGFLCGEMPPQTEEQGWRAWAESLSAGRPA